MSMPPDGCLRLSQVYFSHGYTLLTVVLMEAFLACFEFLVSLQKMIIAVNL